MIAKTTKKILKLQTDFLHACVSGNQTLEDVMDDFHIIPETLAGWLMDREFLIRLQGMRRFLRKARDLQLELGARRAAEVLTRCATDTAVREVKPLQRTACVDLIRLARDSRARARAADPHPDELTKHRALYHPEVPEEEAQELLKELAKNNAASSPANPTERGEVRA